MSYMWIWGRKRQIGQSTLENLGLIESKAREHLEMIIPPPEEVVTVTLKP